MDPEVLWAQEAQDGVSNKNLRTTEVGCPRGGSCVSDLRLDELGVENSSHSPVFNPFRNQTAVIITIFEVLNFKSLYHFYQRAWFIKWLICDKCITLRIQSLPCKKEKGTNIEFFIYLFIIFYFLHSRQSASVYITGTLIRSSPLFFIGTSRYVCIL